MKLDIDNIRREDQSTLDLDFTLNFEDADYFGDSIGIKSPVDVRGKLYAIDYKLYITLKIKTDIEANCNRCLELFVYPFSSSINAELVHESLFDFENDQADDSIIYYEDNIFDLGKLVKEHILMNIPMKLVCDEKCQGLCVDCGVKIEENSCTCEDIQSHKEEIDPRLAKLKKLLPKE